MPITPPTPIRDRTRRQPPARLRAERPVRALSGSYPNPGLAPAESYHEVGAPGEPVFKNGWVNESPTSETTGAFFKDPWSVVHFKGIITSGTGVIFTLPSGYRPTKIPCIPTWRHGAVAYICVDSANGSTFTRQRESTTGAILLDGLSFRLEQARSGLDRSPRGPPRWAALRLCPAAVLRQRRRLGLEQVAGRPLASRRIAGSWIERSAAQTAPGCTPSPRFGRRWSGRTAPPVRHVQLVTV